MASSLRSNIEATRNYSLHTTGWAFDVLRRYSSRQQALAFQFVLDRLTALNLIAWVREPAAIHVTPEAVDGGPIARIHDGDLIRLDAEAGFLEVLVPPGELAARPLSAPELDDNQHGMGRELFANFRSLVGRADQGASAFAA